MPTSKIKIFVPSNLRRSIYGLWEWASQEAKKVHVKVLRSFPEVHPVRGRRYNQLSKPPPPRPRTVDRVLRLTDVVGLGHVWRCTTTPVSMPFYKFGVRSTRHWLRLAYTMIKSRTSLSHERHVDSWNRTCSTFPLRHVVQRRKRATTSLKKWKIESAQREQDCGQRRRHWKLVYLPHRSTRRSSHDRWPCTKMSELLMREVMWTSHKVQDWNCLLYLLVHHRLSSCTTPRASVS